MQTNPVHKRQKSLESFGRPGPRAGGGEAGRGGGVEGEGEEGEGGGRAGAACGAGLAGSGRGPGAETLTVRAVGERDPLGR